MWITVKAASAPPTELASRGWKLRLFFFFFFWRPVISTSVLHFLPAHNEISCVSTEQPGHCCRGLGYIIIWESFPPDSCFFFFFFLVFHWTGVWAAACQIKENKSSLCFPNSWSIFWLQSRTVVQLNARLLSILTNSRLHFFGKVRSPLKSFRP